MFKQPMLLKHYKVNKFVQCNVVILSSIHKLLYINTYIKTVHNNYILVFILPVGVLRLLELSLYAISTRYQQFKY